MVLTLFQTDNSFLKRPCVSPLLHAQILQTIIINVCHRQQGKQRQAVKGLGSCPDPTSTKQDGLEQAVILWGFIFTAEPDVFGLLWDPEPHPCRPKALKDLSPSHLG